MNWSRSGWTTAQMDRLLEWILKGNEDGLPNETRSCYTDTDWKNTELILKHEEIPTDSSHVYQSEECYTKLEELLGA